MRKRPFAAPLVSSAPFTTEVRLEGHVVGEALGSYAALYAQAERAAFVAMVVRQQSQNPVRQQIQHRFGLLKVQADGILRSVRRRLNTARANLEQQAEDLRARINSLEATTAALRTEIRVAPSGSHDRCGPRLLLHQKQRRRQRLQARLRQVEADLSRVIPPVCWGSRRLFHQQFQLGEHGFQTHQHWQRAWLEARAAQFLCLGSKDRTAGNGPCQLKLDPSGYGSIRLRLAPALEAQFGTHLIMPVRFRYGVESLLWALQVGQAISFRFVCRPRRGRDRWYVQVITDRIPVKVRTSPLLGAVGLDFNPGVIALAETDRFGNPVGVKHLHLALGGKSSQQRRAQLAGTALQAVRWAEARGKPLVVERLDFTSKRRRLKEECSRGYARMLSSFSYATFFQLLLLAAQRHGVAVLAANPALSSVIGWAKFGPGYGYSRHQAAAVALARRALGCRERVRAKIGRPHNAPDLPVRNRSRHVWSDWRTHARVLRLRAGQTSVRGGRALALVRAEWGMRTRRSLLGAGPPGQQAVAAPESAGESPSRAPARRQPPGLETTRRTL